MAGQRSSTHTFSDLFVAYLLTRNIPYEEDLVDQLFNSSEKRLARLWFSSKSQMTTSSSSMSAHPDVYLKLVPALRPYFHQITGVVWAASWRRDIRKGIFHDSLSLIHAVGTENVSFQKPVSFGLWPLLRSDCLGNLLRAVQPPAQFLGSVLVDNSDLIFTTVVVRHLFSPSAPQRCALFILDN